MYAYDLMIFCKGTLANMNILKNCFDIYAQAPWQIMNLSKFYYLHMLYFSKMGAFEYKFVGFLSRFYRSFLADHMPFF